MRFPKFVPLGYRDFDNSSQSPAIAALREYSVVSNAAALPITPILSLPRTSVSRLSDSYRTPLSSSESIAQKTVLYLAYGSNLSAATFLVGRGIKPLSSLNVLVPSLSLTFDLPGVPYGEPCFANTGRRGSSSSNIAAYDGSEKGALLPTSSKPLNWSKPMIGVVYEVTPEDYAHIIATEGGGASYQDILVPCHAFPESYNSSSPVPDVPDTPAFVAHTLFAPYQAPAPPDPSHPPWSKPNFRPDPNYAQPSLRYLTLIRTGAREHDLPTEYINYLDSLHDYRITSTRQKVGGAMFLMFWGPIIRAIFLKGRENRDDGPSPLWKISLIRLVFWTVWFSYDWAFKAIAGDGERTIEDEEAPRGNGNTWWDEKKFREDVMWEEERSGETQF